MAMERYFGIRHGYFYMLHFSPQRARLEILIIDVNFAAISTLRVDY